MDLSQQESFGIIQTQSSPPTMIPASAFNAVESQKISSTVSGSVQSPGGFQTDLDDEELLAERKHSQLQTYLQKIKKLDLQTELYKEMAKQSADLESYERDTYLGKPLDADLDKDKVVIEETTSDISMDMGLQKKIDAEKKAPRYDPDRDNAFKVEEYDLLLQYVAGTESPPVLNEKMEIKNDLRRLCQLYLEANTKFKLSMPSENVENLLYEKIVYNICQQQPTSQTAASSNSFRDSSSMISGSMVSPYGSVHSDKSFNKSSSSLMSESTTSFSNLSASQNLSAANRNSTLSKNSKSVVAPIIVRTEEKKIEQCTPYIVRMDSEGDAEKQLWQELVDELRINSTVTADILCLILENAYSQDGGLDLAHRTMLVNLAQFFFDNIYQDDRMAYSENNLFLRIFLKFASSGISQDHFTKDSIGQVQFKSEALRQMIMCLFEGITRKIPSFNFLRFVFGGPFNRVNMYQMDQDIRRIDSQPKPGTEKGKPDSKEKKDEEKKPGFFKKIWGSVFDKKIKDEIKKEEAKKQIKDGEMAFGGEEEEVKAMPTINNGQPPRLFSAMTVVYGGPVDPFESSGTDPSQLKRFESIEQRIQEERLNTHKLVCQDKAYGFKPRMHDRIIMTEDDIRRQFENRASIQSNRADQPKPPAVKTKKDLTYYIKSLVQKNFEQMINFQQKIPFAIRAMLRIILIRTRGLSDFNQRISVESHEVALLAQILVGGWLNTGQRNPKCFGIQPTVEKELELEFIFFQAARITFEHLMMMQRIPDEKRVDGFSVFQLNDMIKELAPQVFLFWIRLINVDISEINNIPSESLIQQSIIRVKDIELLYTYCKKTYYIFKDVPVKADDPLAQKRKSFNQVMEKIEKLGIDIEVEEESTLADQIIFESSSEKDKPALVKPNRFFRNMSEYFQNHIDLWNVVPTPHEQFEYYLLFMRKKNDQNLQKKFEEVLQQQKNKIKLEAEKFVAQYLFTNGQQSAKSETSASQMLGPAESSPDQKIESPLPRILQSPILNTTNSQQLESDHTTMASSSKQTHHQSAQIQQTGGMKVGESGLRPRLVKLSRLSDDQIPIETVTQMVINIFNTLRMVVKKKEMILEKLKDNSSNEELRDLVQILVQAAFSNRASSKPDLYLQAGCQHLANTIKKLNLEQQFSIQNKLLAFFCDILSGQQTNFKQLCEIFYASVQQFGADVFRFEQNITNLKQFHKKFDNQLTFNKTISRYNPEVCLLSHNYELLDDFRYYKGVLLNLSCSNHQTGLPISSYMLFGVVRRSVAGVLEQPVSSSSNQQTQQALETYVISEDELNMKKVRDNRVSRYRDHHMAYTTVTVSLQNNNTMEIKPKDEPIKLIEAFIQFYTNKQKNNLRTMIRADEEKHRAILPLDLVPGDKFSFCKNEKDRYNVLSEFEPFDYMNLLHTYVMFLQHISVMSSQNPKDDYINETSSKVKQHYDFLRFDLQARTLRFSIHDYIMRRMHKTIFNQTKPFPKDELVQKLILDKQNHPDWVLTSAQSQAAYQKYLVTKDKIDEPKDFTSNPEWTNTHIYSSSLKTLLKIIDEETPHLKAIYITEAQNCAIHSLQIAAPYEKLEKYGADLQNRVTKHLMVEVCKIYEKAKTNSRLYSQLMFIHLFNIPVQEHVNWNLLNKHADYMVNELMSLKEQHTLYLGELPTRNVAYDMFAVIKDLLKEYYANEKSK